jgi:hypothetical protein
VRVLFSNLGLAEGESAEVVNLSASTLAANLVSIGSGWRFSESAMTVVAITNASEQGPNIEKCK